MAAEQSIVTSAVIPAAQEDVWKIVNDTSRYAEWVEATLEVTRSDGEGVVGATYDERNKVAGPLKGSSRWRVVACEPMRRTLHEGEGLPLVSNLSIETLLEPAGESCEVTLRLRYDTTLGPLGSLINSFSKGQVEAEQRKSLDNLAALVEREVGVRTPVSS